MRARVLRHGDETARFGLACSRTQPIITTRKRRMPSPAAPRCTRLAADAAAAAPKELTQEIVRLKGAAAAQKEATLLALCRCGGGGLGGWSYEPLSPTVWLQARLGFAARMQLHIAGARSVVALQPPPSTSIFHPMCFPTLQQVVPGRAHHHLCQDQAAGAPPQNAVWAGGAAARGRAARRHDSGGTPRVAGALPQGEAGRISD